MPESWFSLDLIQLLLENRNGPATVLFQLATFLGEIEGYVLVVSLIFVAYDKELAFRLSALTLVTMSLNHLLKMLIANPRPFISEGTYAEKWAVSAAKAQELATEYSTPSGHAMAGAGFYSYLYASVKNRYVRIVAIVSILLTGLSRPYVGVHYLEDVFIGWALGMSIALLSIKFARNIGNAWNKRPLHYRVLIVVGASIVLWLATRALDDSTPDAQPLAFVSYTGFLAGIVLAYPLEAKWVRFDPRSSTTLRRILRYVLSVTLVIGSLLLLDEVFQRIAGDSSLLGNVLRYVRYATAAIAGFLLGPFLFVRLGLASTYRLDSVEPSE
jgi:membrane-associated phospholipid phosphatase